MHQKIFLNLTCIWDTDFIEQFAQLLTAGGTQAGVCDIEGTPAVIVQADADDSATGYTLSIEHPYEDMTYVHLLLPMFSGLDESITDSIISLIRYLNKFLSTSCFVASAKDGDVYFRYSFVIDEQMEKTALFMLTAEVIDICEETAAMGMDIIVSLIEGKTPLSELLNDDTAIIQQ